MDYLLLIKVLLSVISLGLLITVSSLFLVYQEVDISKYSAYECGFNPYGDARMKFDVKYYIIAILFLIFDLELVFLYPFVISIKFIGMVGISSMFFFVMVLGYGLFYELVVGYLDWYIE